MARPRVFISSTYFDLKSIREDLERFVVGMGYDAVRHERGHISYGSDERPEAYAFREIDGCDIVLAIIGGSFGTQAAGSDYSISQKELKRALELGKQVYIFVERGVHSEYGYYKNNKDVPGVRYTAVNDPRVYSFLEEISLLPKGNPTFQFDTGLEISNILREQWAGLFQRLVSQEANRKQASLTEELQRSLQTVDQLVKFLTDEKTKGNKAIDEILFSNHPIFEAVRVVTRNKYRLYFANLNEFNVWLETARNFTPVPEVDWDGREFREWVKDVSSKGKKEIQVLFVKKDLFDADGQLKQIGPTEWDDAWVRVERREISSPTPAFSDFDDDIPF